MEQSTFGHAKEGLTSGSLWEMVGKKRVVTFIGAGGKTTCLLRLTEELGQTGKSVIATTTTKVFPLSFSTLWQSREVIPPREIISPCFWYAKCEDTSGKWRGIPLALLDQAIREDPAGYSRFWVIEGDGARERQLKCWATHEPQIPDSTEAAVLVIAGGLWGKTLEEKDVHRSELNPGLLGKVWCPELAWQYILNSPVFYSTYSQMSWSILFNSGSGPEKRPRLSLASHELRKLLEIGKRFLARDPASKGQLPQHLRIALGDAKEGRLQWYDLW